MKTLVDNLSQYAAYHRDRRNIATHFIGIPMIVQAVAILSARPNMEWMGLQWSPASISVIVGAIYYLLLDLRYGAVMSLLLGAALLAASASAELPLGSWLTLGVSLFVVGWILQFIGHYYEGRKPAFVDDVMGLAIGPLFVVAEAGFVFGLRPEVKAAMDAPADTVMVSSPRVPSRAQA